MDIRSLNVTSWLKLNTYVGMSNLLTEGLISSIVGADGAIYGFGAFGITGMSNLSSVGISGLDIGLGVSTEGSG